MGKRHRWYWDDTYASVIGGPREAEIYHGTNRDDVLVGTRDDDQFYPGLGTDTVDGRGGHDSLFVDYSALNASIVASITYDSATGYTGEFRAIRNPASASPRTVSDITFKGIEDIEFLATGGGRAHSATVAVTVAPRGADSTLNLDGGGARYAYIQIDVKAIEGISLAMAADGSIISEAGSFRNFSSYRVLFGDGENIYRGGDSYATAVFSNITSSADGGGFHKTSVDYYLRTTDDITLHVSGRNGSFSGGAGFTDAELGDFYGGSGVNRLYTDSFGRIGRLADLKGRNELYVDLTSGGSGVDFDLSHYSKTDYFHTVFWPIDGSSKFYILGDFTLGDGLVNVLLSPDSDHVSYNFVEGDVLIDGGAGTDTLSITLNSDGRPDPYTLNRSLEFVVDHDRATIAGGSTFLNFESVHVVGGRHDDLLSGMNRQSAPGLIDYIYGLGGNDTTTYQYTDAAVTVSLAVSGVQDTGGGGNDVLFSIENLIGSSYADVLTGSATKNMLDGGAGNDELAGGAGNDKLIGGIGADELTGGGGADHFIFTGLADFATGPILDRVSDFSRAEHDRIDLSAIDTDPGATGDQPFAFIGQQAFHAGSAQAELRIEQAANGDWLVQGDLNHDGQADVAFLVHAEALRASDFIL